MSWSWQERKDRMEQDARIALLQHFSSKSSNQAIIFLTLAAAFFAFTQTLLYFQNAQFSFLPRQYQSYPFRAYVFACLLSFSFLTVRAIGRMQLWSGLARAVFIVEIQSEEFMKSELRKEVEELKGANPNTKIDLVPTLLYRLQRACDNYVTEHTRAQNRWVRLVSWCTHGKGLRVATLLMTIALLIGLFLPV